MKHFRITFFFLVAALALGGCSLGGSDGSEVSIAEDVEAQPTVNSVQAVPSQDSTAEGDTVADQAEGSAADAALPTAVTLPTAAPTPEPTVDRSQPTTYIVQSGDVLGLIAERFDADIAELRLVNNLDGNLIQVGQTLTIPALDGSTETTTEDSTESADAAPAATSAPTTSAPVSCSSAATGHCVQPGESLLGIALQLDVDVDALRAANPGVVGDLIKSGEVLNVPGGTTTTDPVTVDPVTSVDSADPVATVGPLSDADCEARNPAFPFFHDADGLCYANPISSTPAPTVPPIDPTCPEGRFFFEDTGLCELIPEPTATTLPDYGTVPCRDGYLPLESGRCWPEPATTPSTIVPGAAATTTSTSNTSTNCVEPNFTQQGSTCFLLADGEDKGCTVVNNEPSCPAGTDT